jgi:transposase
MIFLPANVRVFVAPGSTDMRKAINSLSILVEATLRLDPFSGHLFVFCNQGRTILKILYWDRNGFCLYADLDIKTIMLSSKLCRVEKLAC